MYSSDHSTDPAFIDRADIKQYIGLPTAEAIYVILGSCLSELSKKGLLKGSVALKSFSESREADATTPSRKLVDVANRCQVRSFPVQ